MKIVTGASFLLAMGMSVLATAQEDGAKVPFEFVIQKVLKKCGKLDVSGPLAKAVMIVAIDKKGGQQAYICDDNWTGDEQPYETDKLPDGSLFAGAGGALYTKYKLVTDKDPCIELYTASGLKTIVCWKN